MNLKNYFLDRLCPAINICGVGECMVTTHPLKEFQFVCKCKDRSYKFEACSALAILTTTTTSLKIVLCSIDTQPICKNNGVCYILNGMVSCACQTGFSVPNRDISNL